MIFGKKDRPLYIANVHYYGDVDAIDVEPEDLDIRAWVEAPEPPDLVPGRNALVGLATMLAPQHLFMNATAASGALYPAIDLLREASTELLKGESAARFYMAEGKAITVGGAPESEYAETVEGRIPIAVPEPEGKSSRVQEFALMQRGDDIWARSRAPEEGGQAFFANSGLMLLIQHIAREFDYEETIVPVAAGLGAFVGQFEAYEAEVNEDRDEDVAEENWAAFGVGILTSLEWDATGVVAYSDDPRKALTEFSES